MTKSPHVPRRPCHLHHRQHNFHPSVHRADWRAHTRRDPCRPAIKWRDARQNQPCSHLRSRWNPYLNKWRDAKTYIALIFALTSHLMKILLSSILLSWDYTLLSRYHWRRSTLYRWYVSPNQDWRVWEVNNLCPIWHATIQLLITSYLQLCYLHHRFQLIIN